MSYYYQNKRKIARTITKLLPSAKCERNFILIFEDKEINTKIFHRYKHPIDIDHEYIKKILKFEKD